MSLEYFLEKLESKYDVDLDKTSALKAHIKYLFYINSSVELEEKHKINTILLGLDHVDTSLTARTKNNKNLAILNKKIHKNNNVCDYPHTTFLSTLPPVNTTLKPPLFAEY